MSDKENIEFQIQKLQVDTINAIEQLERDLEEARELLGMLNVRGNELYNDNWQYERDYLNEVKNFLKRTEK